MSGGIRVPAVISYPRENWGGGWRLKQATSMMDIYPTILSQAGVSPTLYAKNEAGEENALDGKDISALLNEGEKETPTVPSPHEFFYPLGTVFDKFPKITDPNSDLIPTMPSDKYQKPSKKTKKGSKVGRTMMTRSMRQPIQQPRSKSFRA